MKIDQSHHLTREESFDIETPEVSVMTISSEVTIIESVDGKSHVQLLSKSEKTKNLAELVEIIATDKKLTVRIDKRNHNHWGLGDGGLHGLSVILMLPMKSTLKIKTVSADIEVNQTLARLEIASVSGDVTILQNPEGSCVVKTVSGDISTHTFSACDYTLKSISGDIRVNVAPDLEVDVDGNSISGDLKSEISLNAGGDSPTNSTKVVKITTTTISGDFNLARN